ncbi:MAG: hypothetical protein QOI43_2921 [Gaiellales bacterium]|nr:hypothetical protein [Gaiellales bacterium]
MSAVETQPDVGGLSALLQGMEGEPHDRRRVIDAQLVAFASKPHFPGQLGCLGPHRRAHNLVTDRPHVAFTQSAGEGCRAEWLVGLPPAALSNNRFWPGVTRRCHHPETANSPVGQGNRM